MHIEQEVLVVDEVETLSFIVVSSANVFEWYLLDQNEPFNQYEREEIEQELAQQPPITLLNIWPDDPGETHPPKREPS